MKVLKKISKKRLIKIICIVFIIVLLMYFLLNCTNLINKTTDTFMVENGTLSYEEETVRIYY
jgi:hypothetical protein